MIEKKNFLSLLSPAASSLSLSQKKKNRSGENQFLHFFSLFQSGGGGGRMRRRGAQPGPGRLGTERALWLAGVAV